MKKLYLAVIAVAYWCSVAGQLDPGFGNQGIVRTDFGSNEPLYDNLCRQILQHPDGSFYLVFEMNRQSFVVHRFANGVLDNGYGKDGYSVPLSMRTPKAILQADGKIVVGGTVINNTEDFGLARLNTNGSLDISFSGGKVITDFSSARDNLFALALQADGKIIAGGRTDDNVQYRFALARYLTNGTLDNTFSGDGKQVTGVPVRGSIASLAVQGDGKIIAAGDSYNTGITSMAIARYSADGNLDPSFSGDGVQLVTSGWNSVAKAIITQNDGKIAAGGFSLNSINQMRFMLARLNTDGSFDNTFSTDGIQISDFGGNDASIEAMALQTDGKIVAAGFANFGSLPANRDFAAARYNTDGSLDFSFSGDGLIFPEVTSSGMYPFASAFSIVLQADSRIMLAGSCSYDDIYAVVRLTTDGSMDTGFDGDGILRDYKAAGNTAYNASAVQSDGKIVTAGVTGRPYANTMKFAVARYNTDGTLDNNFSGDGMLTVDFGFGSAEAFDIAIQPNGKIVVAGVAMNGQNRDFALVRLNPDGNLDNSFSGDGKLLTDVGGSDDGAYGVSIQANGKIVLAGYNSTEGANYADFAIVRYNVDGSLDNSFSGDGILTAGFDASNDMARDILIQPDGKIIAIGFSEAINDSSYLNISDIALMRFNADGSPDMSFDGDGKLTTNIHVDIVEGSSDYAYAASLQPDGKIIVGGSASWNFAFLRYNSNGTLDNSFSGDGILVFELIPSIETMTSLVVLADGKIIGGGYTTNGFTFNLELVCVKANGITDSSFAEDGQLVLDLGYDNDYIQSLSLHGNHLYAAGETAYGGQLGLLAAFMVGCPMEVNIPDSKSLPRGVEPNTVYIGYAPASTLTLTAQPSAGEAPYTYLWNNGATTRSIRVSPTTNTVYSVTVFDASGCSATSSKLVKVVDVRCGSKQEKILVCQMPPGNHGNAHTNCISADAVQAHLNSGSYLGSCRKDENCPDQTILKLDIHPNPSSSAFTITVWSNSDAMASLIVWDESGRIIERRRINVNQRIQVGASYRPGIYFVEITQGNKEVRAKLFKRFH